MFKAVAYLNLILNGIWWLYEATQTADVASANSFTMFVLIRELPVISRPTESVSFDDFYL